MMAGLVKALSDRPTPRGPEDSSQTPATMPAPRPPGTHGRAGA